MKSDKIFHYGDYGSFDSRFFGIILKFDDPNKYKRFNDLIKIDKYKNLNFEEIWMLTVLDHEHRHFHDSLLSPTAGGLTSLRINNILNGLQFIHLLNKHYSELNANLIPVPISKWINLSKEEKKEKLNLLKNFTKHKEKFELVPLKIFSFDELKEEIKNPENILDFSAHLNMINHNYQVMKEILTNEVPSSQGPIRPRDIYELSAFCLQYQASYQMLGKKEAGIFIKSISEHAPEYLKCFILMIEIWTKYERKEWRIFHLFTTWCILGNRVLEHKRNGFTDYKMTQAGCPAYRFCTIIEYLTNNGIPPEETSVETLFQKWDQIVQSAPWNECLDADLTSAKKRHETISNESTKLPNGSLIKELYQLASRFYEMLYENKKIIHEKFLENPVQYTTPENYIALQSQLPTASIWTTFANFSVLNTPPRTPSKEYLPIFAKNNLGETVIMSELKGTESNMHCSLEDLQTLHTYNCFFDYLFASFHRDEIHQLNFQNFLSFDCLELF